MGIRGLDDYGPSLFPFFLFFFSFFLPKETSLFIMEQTTLDELAADQVRGVVQRVVGAEIEHIEPCFPCVALYVYMKPEWKKEVDGNFYIVRCKDEKEPTFVFLNQNEPGDIVYRRVMIETVFVDGLFLKVIPPPKEGGDKFAIEFSEAEDVIRFSGFLSGLGV
jgi:hypothetical protein